MGDVYVIEVCFDQEGRNAIGVADSFTGACDFANTHKSMGIDCMRITLMTPTPVRVWEREVSHGAWDGDWVEQ